MSTTSNLEVGPHDPIPLSAPRLGHWIECECSWISASYYTPEDAMKAHQKHTEKATS